MTNQSESSRIDEFTTLVAICLSFSSIFSFFFIRATNPKKAQVFETIADYCFIASLAGILLIILFISLRLLR